MRAEQFAFAVQWRRLREHAHSRGVRLFGDLPFYVAPDSAETWAHRKQFQLDATGRATAVAGVPPDYFSETGQLWGNPLYDWRAMRRDGFTFWRARVRRQLERVDLLRIDHFRALAAHWSVPGGRADARGGSWQPTPGRAVAGAARGLRRPADRRGRSRRHHAGRRGVAARSSSLPGMRVLQFGFSARRDNPHLPHMHDATASCTPARTTTTRRSAGFSASTRNAAAGHLPPALAPGSMSEALIRAALGSVGELAVIPVQDVLALGSEARLNTPGTASGNWTWRLAPRWRCRAGTCTRGFLRLNRIYGRA